jgi:hypothetical protein
MSKMVKYVNPTHMSDKDLNDEIDIMLKAMAQYSPGDVYYMEFTTRMNQCQNEIARRNAEKSASSAEKLSKFATYISLLALMVTLFFSVCNYFMDQQWQHDEIKVLQSIDKNTLIKTR